MVPNYFFLPVGNQNSHINPRQPLMLHANQDRGRSRSPSRWERRSSSVHSSRSRSPSRSRSRSNSHHHVTLNARASGSGTIFFLLQVNKYATDLYFLQNFQSNTTVSLIIPSFCKFCLVFI